MMKVIVDADEAQRQMLELATLISARYPEGAPDDILEALSNIAKDRVITDGGSTVGANGDVEIITKKLKFGTSFDVFKATLTGVASSN